MSASNNTNTYKAKTEEKLKGEMGKPIQLLLNISMNAHLSIINIVSKYKNSKDILIELKKQNH